MGEQGIRAGFSGIAARSELTGVRRVGVRVDFTGRNLRRTAYLDEEMAGTLRRIMDQLEADIKRIGVTGYLGSCEFRDRPELYPLTADYSMGARDGGLRVWVDGYQEMFEGKSPADLSAMLLRALMSI